MYIHIVVFQEESDSRLAVQEALSMMAPSYKKADATILALIESLILSYVEQVIFTNFTCTWTFTYTREYLHDVVLCSMRILSILCTVIGIKGARVAILCERQHSACPLILLRFKMLEDKITDYSRAALWSGVWFGLYENKGGEINNVPPLNFVPKQQKLKEKSN